jgi:hypothetical protein
MNRRDAFLPMAGLALLPTLGGVRDAIKPLPEDKQPGGKLTTTKELRNRFAALKNVAAALCIDIDTARRQPDDRVQLNQSACRILMKFLSETQLAIANCEWTN